MALSRTPLAALALASALALPPGGAAAQDCMLGEVRLFAAAYEPQRWALADGRLLQISRHNALFAVLGVTYGGDGRTTFALPDMRGRSPLRAADGGEPAFGRPADQVVNHLVCMEGYFPVRE